MPVLRDARRRSIPLVFTVLGICLVMYVAYYTIDGRRGLKSMLRLQGQVSVAEARLDVVQTQRASLENQVSKLRSNSIDPDLLDERARAVLNFTRPNDLIIRQDAK